MKLTDPDRWLRLEEGGISKREPVKRFIRRFPQPVVVRLHYHSSLEVNVCRAVEGVLRVEDREYDLADVGCVVLPPETLHSYDISAGSGTIEVLHVALPLLDRWIRVDEIVALARRLHPDRLVFCADGTSISGGGASGDRRGDSLRSLVTQMTTARSDPFAGLSFVFAALSALGDWADSDRPARSSWIRRVVDFTEENFAGPISLAQAAEVAGWSRSVFTRRFHAETGSTYHEFLTRVRLEHARGLLVNGASVTESASASGFSDASHFIRRFREVYRRTPARWGRTAGGGGLY